MDVREVVEALATSLFSTKSPVARRRWPCRSRIEDVGGRCHPKKSFSSATITSRILPFLLSGVVRVHEWVVYVQWRPLERLRCFYKVVEFLVGLGSLFDPLGEEAAVFFDGAVELRVWVLFPGLLLHDLGSVQLFWVNLPAEVELPRDELVQL